MKVWSETKTGSDGNEYSVPYLLSIEHLQGLQSVGLVGEVCEVLGMQDIADCVMADFEKQIFTACGGVVQ